MKKILALALLSLSITPLSAARKKKSSRAFDKIEKAIKSGQLTKVKSAFRGFNDDAMSTTEKKEALEEFYTLAEEQYSEKLAAIAPYRNWKDLLRTVWGTSTLINCIRCVLQSREGVRDDLERSNAMFRNSDLQVQEVTEERISAQQNIIRISSLLWGSLASYVLYNGVTCYSQRFLLKEYEEIAEYVNNQLEDLELVDEA